MTGAPWMEADRLARWEGRLRPLMTRLPPALALRLYARGRRHFLRTFAVRATGSPPPATEVRRLWHLDFRQPLGNAAGMFKNGEAYPVVAAQGAGFYVAGTTTARPRQGNRRHGVSMPFAPYPRSGAASNWLGLPNEGHEVVAGRLAQIEKVPGCPLGASVAADTGDGVTASEATEGLVRGLVAYDRAGVDFLELNESCPNTEDDDVQGGAGEDMLALADRLEAVADGFLRRRGRPLPVLVKVSCDTATAQVAPLLALLVDKGFDGVVFGNTSTDYARHRAALDPREIKLYDRFTECFGGGVSGRPLRDDSLRLVVTAAAALRQRPVERPFHIVRTGGVESPADVAASLAAGADLCQWYTGYFEAFARRGHAVYAPWHDDPWRLR